MLLYWHGFAETGPTLLKWTAIYIYSKWRNWRHVRTVLILVGIDSQRKIMGGVGRKATEDNIVTITEGHQLVKWLV